MTLPVKQLKTSFLISRTTLPVSKLDVKYHAMKHADEKVFILLRQDVTFIDLIDNVGNLLNNCAYGVDINKLPMEDIEFLLLKIHIASKGAISNLRYRCQNKVEDKECGEIIKHDLDLNDIKPTFPEKEQQSLIKIEGTDLTIKLKSVTFGDLQHIPDEGGKLNPENITDNIALSIDSIIEGEGDDAIIYDEFTKAEIVKFIEGLPVHIVRDITDKFIGRSVSLTHDVDLTCTKCGYQGTLNLKGLLNFIR